ncbi:ribonuclease H-like domain-containing protein [Tanacetum coccineum]
MVRSMWLFKHKFHADGTLSRYKARLVANGSSQQLGVDFDETFSPVIKAANIRTILSLAVSRKWPIHQLDVKNAFLNGDLSETGSHVAYLLIYVDDIILTSSSPAPLQQITDSLHKEFDMTDLLLERAYIVHCNPSRTPVNTKTKPGLDGVPVQDLTLYRSLAGGLQYLTFTRPYLSYAIQQICLYMHDPREPHFAALKRVLRYVKGTLDFGLHLYASATTSLVGYTDADWAGCPSTRRTTSVYYDNVSAIYMSANPVQHQRTKHIEIDIHFVCDIVTTGHVRVLHVPSHFQYADIFTNGLPSVVFEDF